MKLTSKDLEKINNIPSLIRLCKEVERIAESGVNGGYCLSILDSNVELFRVKCPSLKVIELNRGE